LKILVTGGAGFIGSNLVEKLLQQENVALVRVMDNLLTGSLNNIKEFRAHPKFEFVEADIRNYNSCLSACSGIDVISHQAALGSVPRSIADPLTTNEINITGTLHIFNAAKENGIKKIVYAASSSTYGDSETLPKVENNIGRPLSPYAVTKYVNELYADVFNRLYQIDIIGLRYFNVFGPKQNPDGPYAAVIPLFMDAVMNDKSPFINGDGEQSRDFTFVLNAVQANINAIFSDDKKAWNQVYNIAFGEKHSINQLFDTIKSIAEKPHLKATHRQERVGDIRDSLANISKAKTLLNYNPPFSVKDGLLKTWEWYSLNEDYFKQKQ
jgi:UDP-N-acetylglucosamine 4-epimerase